MTPPKPTDEERARDIALQIIGKANWEFTDYEAPEGEIFVKSLNTFLIEGIIQALKEAKAEYKTVYDAAIKWYHETDGFDSQQLSDVIAKELGDSK